MLKAPLLSRLEGRYEANSTLASHDYSQVIEQSLIALLNTKRDGVAMTGDYGLEDFNSTHFHHADLIRQVEVNMWQTIHHYEPRLRQVKVVGSRLVDQPDRLLFTVHAQLRKDTGTEDVCYFTLFTGSGRVVMQG